MKKDYKITAFDLKLALLQYFRFRRGWICIDEFRGADIIVDTGKEIIEVETKITKSDLINGERKKVYKHQCYKGNFRGFNIVANKFMFCVPEKLVEITKDWVNELNPNYGIIGFDAERFTKYIQKNWSLKHSDFLRIAKSAKRLRDGYSDKVRWDIAKRTSSKIVSINEQLFRMKREKA